MKHRDTQRFDQKIKYNYNIYLNSRHPFTPCIYSPALTLNLGYKKLEFERIDNLNSILAKKINEIKCNPNLSVHKLIKDYD